MQKGYLILCKVVNETMNAAAGISGYETPASKATVLRHYSPKKKKRKKEKKI